MAAACGCCVRMCFRVCLRARRALRQNVLTDVEHRCSGQNKDCNLKVSVTKRASAGAESAVPEAWLVTVHSADQIPNMDKHGPAWGLNITGTKVCVLVCAHDHVRTKIVCATTQDNTSASGDQQSLMP